MGDLQREAFASQPRRQNDLRSYLDERADEFGGLNPWQRVQWRAKVATAVVIALIFVGSVALIGADVATYITTGHGIR